jgi:hypothetical protein
VSSHSEAASAGAISVYSTQIHFAQPTIVLPRRARSVRAGFLVCALIQNQGAALSQDRRHFDLGLNLSENGLARPGRLCHKMFQRLSIATVQRSIYVGKVSFPLHGQLSPQIVVGVPARVAGAGFETGRKSQPEPIEAISQLGRNLWRNPPTVRGIHINVLGVCKVIRSLIPQVTLLPNTASRERQIWE